MAIAQDARVARAVQREIRELQEMPCEGIRVAVNEENLTDIVAEIDGPAGTPYDDGVFRLRLLLPADYPTNPPKGHFTTRIFHPNVAKTGEICVNVLKRDWSPGMGLRHVLLVLRCLLIQPFPESALNEEAGKLLLDDYEEYAKRAEMLTRIHATPQGRRSITQENCSGSANVDSNTNKGSGSVTRSREDTPGSPSTPAVKRSKGSDKKPTTTKTARRTGLRRL